MDENESTDALIMAAKYVNDLMHRGSNSIFDQIEIRFRIDEHGNRIRRCEVVRGSDVIETFED